MEDVKIAFFLILKLHSFRSSSWLQLTSILSFSFEGWARELSDTFVGQYAASIMEWNGEHLWVVRGDEDGSTDGVSDWHTVSSTIQCLLILQAFLLLDPPASHSI